jgi:hypothetical protein
MRMTARALDKALLGRDGTVNILGRNPLLFREAVRNHGGYVLMKEIKHAIIYAPDLYWGVNPRRDATAEWFPRTVTRM